MSAMKRAAAAKTEADPAGDGRTLRRARNHDLIVAAVYELVRAGNVEPTIDEVAARAGVAARTIFRQFHDLETLSRSLGERVLGESFALVEPRPPTGRLLDDLAALVEQRARVFEHLAPFRRAARVVRHRVAFVREQDAMMTRMLRTGLEAVLAAHVGARGGELVEALDVLLSFEAWDRLRDQQKLSQRRATGVLIAAATALAAAAAKAR
jgi:AcrR family transcriptional regulator